jgi:hypothetical protein
MAMGKPAVFLFTEHGLLEVGKALCNSVFPRRHAALRLGGKERKENLEK